MQPIALYVHIPFCETKCPYCDFNTYAKIESLIPDYVTALRTEIEFVGRNTRQSPYMYRLLRRRHALLSALRRHLHADGDHLRVLYPPGRRGGHPRGQPGRLHSRQAQPPSSNPASTGSVSASRASMTACYVSSDGATLPPTPTRHTAWRMTPGSTTSAST